MRRRGIISTPRLKGTVLPLIPPQRVQRAGAKRAQCTSVGGTSVARPIAYLLDKARETDRLIVGSRLASVTLVERSLRAQSLTHGAGTPQSVERCEAHSHPRVRVTADGTPADARPEIGRIRRYPARDCDGSPLLALKAA